MWCQNADSMEPSCKEKLQKLRRSTERLEEQQAPHQEDVADLVAAATELLQLSGSVAESAEKVFGLSCF